MCNTFFPANHEDDEVYEFLDDDDWVVVPKTPLWEKMLDLAYEQRDNQGQYNLLKDIFYDWYELWVCICTWKNDEDAAAQEEQCLVLQALLDDFIDKWTAAFVETGGYYLHLFQAHLVDILKVNGTCILHGGGGNVLCFCVIF